MPRKPTEAPLPRIPKLWREPGLTQAEVRHPGMIPSIRSFVGKRMAVVRDGGNVIRLCRPEPTPGAAWRLNGASFERAGLRVGFFVLARGWGALTFCF